MADKLYKINNGTVTLYLEHYKEKQFNLQGFTVTNDRDNYYVISRSLTGSCPFKNRNAVPIGDYLFKIYKSEADVQLREYIDDNINDYSFYGQQDEDEFMFWNKVASSAWGNSRIKEYYDLDISDVTNGFVGISINGILCKHSFIEGKTIAFEPPSHYSGVITSYMEVFYRGYLNDYIALEQHKRGMSVPAYTELERLREFLKDKRSVKLVMKSGMIYDLKKDSIYINDILKQYSTNGKLCFYLNNSYHLRPDMKNKLPIDDLDYLQYGKNKHYINKQRLFNCTRPNIMKGIELWQQNRRKT